MNTRKVSLTTQIKQPNQKAEPQSKARIINKLSKVLVKLDKRLGELNYKMTTEGLSYFRLLLCGDFKNQNLNEIVHNCANDIIQLIKDELDKHKVDFCYIVEEE